jgi:hypothetical protein
MSTTHPSDTAGRRRSTVRNTSTKRNTLQRERPDVGFSSPDAAKIFSLITRHPGISNADIASRLELPVTRVRSIVRGLKLRGDFPAPTRRGQPRSKKALTGEPLNREVLRLHAEGLDNAAIGRQVGYSREWIRVLLEKLGKTPNLKCVRERRILLGSHAKEYLRQAVPRRQIAKLLGCHVCDINDLISIARQGHPHAVPGLAAAIEAGRVARAHATRPLDRERQAQQDRVHAAFIRSCMSSTEVAERTGWKYLLAHHRVNGRKVVTQYIADTLAPLFKVSAAWIMTGSPAPAWLANGETTASVIRDDSAQIVGLRRLLRSRGMSASEMSDKIEADGVIRIVRPRRPLRGRGMSASERPEKIDADGVIPSTWFRLLNGMIPIYRYLDPICKALAVTPAQLLELGRQPGSHATVSGKATNKATGKATVSGTKRKTKRRVKRKA